MGKYRLHNCWVFFVNDRLIHKFKRNDSEFQGLSMSAYHMLLVCRYHNLFNKMFNRLRSLTTYPITVAMAGLLKRLTVSI